MSPIQPPPLELSRRLHAPRQTVFRAWGTAQSVMRWFAPLPYTIPEAEIDFRAGGTFDLTMRGPAGDKSSIKGRIVELVPNERLVIDMRVIGAGGAEAPLFRAYTELTFADALGGTELHVRQTYTFDDPVLAAPMVAGAPVGWGMTLDQLDQEVVRLTGGSGSALHPATHGTFRIERRYAAAPARVWAALTEPAAKAKWFTAPPGTWELVERTIDIRVGGRERLKGRWQTGLVSCFDALYHDVVPGRRLIYSYEMHLDDKKISVSLATMEIAPDGDGTTLTLTEQGAFLDGYDDAGAREHGTNQLMDMLGASLAD